ncbi:MAG TPA: SprT family zinc-dependent metalloprotease [Phycisphaerae bacterium]|nr:SprT family zinc-dependent metalloprotease [Phycisphaerae bacterium]
MNSVTRYPDQVQFIYGGKSVIVEIMFRDKDSLTISVHPNLRVTALAPINRSIEQIARRIQARASWIFKQQREFERYQPLPTHRRYVSGETHFYLGRQYRLKIRQAATDRVQMQCGYIFIDTRRPKHKPRVRRLLEDWYRTRARMVLDKRFGHCIELARTLDVPNQKPILRKMVKRWGSCGKNQRILLNPDLIKVPPPCIDYVVIHELCHLKILHHNKKFYALLFKYMPDWEKRKQRLDAIALPAA